MKTQLKYFREKDKYILITENGLGMLYAITENVDHAAYIVKCVNSHAVLAKLVNEAKRYRQVALTYNDKDFLKALGDASDILTESEVSNEQQTDN